MIRKYAFIVQRIDTGKTYEIKLKPGIKPAQLTVLVAWQIWENQMGAILMN